MKKELIAKIRSLLGSATPEYLHWSFGPMEDHLILLETGWDTAGSTDDWRLVEIEGFSWKRIMDSPVSSTGPWKAIVGDPGLFIDKNENLYSASEITGGGVLGRLTSSELDDTQGELFIHYAKIGKGLERLNLEQLQHVWNEIKPREPGKIHEKKACSDAIHVS